MVIFNRDSGIVESSSDRFKSYHLCQHSLSITENEGLLNIFL